MIEAIREAATHPAAPAIGAVACRLLAMLEGEREPAEAHAARQRAQLCAIAQHFAATSVAFAQRLAAAGLQAAELAREGGLARLPVVGRRWMQDAPDRVFASRVSIEHQPVHETASSGSTGEPVRVRRTLTTQVEWLANTLRMHLWHGADPAWRYAALRAKLPAPRLLPDWGPPAAWFVATGPMLVVPNGLSIDEQARHLRAFAPELLLGYPSNLLALLDAGVPPPRQVRTIGETLSPADRAAIERAWGCTVVDLYSSEEVGTIALGCTAGGYHAAAESLIVEILDGEGRPCRSGEEGRVVVTDLINLATPIVRYDLGDRAIAGGPCGCGRTLPALARVAGRERNLIQMPDGSRHWPLTGRDRFRDVAPVRQFQLRQTGRETIEVRLVVDRPLTPIEESALAGIMAQALGHGFAFDFRYFDDRLPLGPTGKLEEFLCLIQP